jgi:hypothetical protein
MIAKIKYIKCSLGGSFFAAKDFERQVYMCDAWLEPIFGSTLISSIEFEALKKKPQGATGFRKLKIVRSDQISFDGKEIYVDTSLTEYLSSLFRGSMDIRICRVSFRRE